ncbi:MAG TPA: acetate--CoA ligase family protein, partial [Burkholderiales bacterium]|nr:acetate--CoA ligase family protein [Burkholderiales bacterium]
MSTTLPAPDLATFFNPASLAFVGATEDISKFGGRVMRAVLEFGFKGRVYPVNPRYATLLGQPCYPSVSALPEAPDHVGIVIAANRVLDTLKQCADKGARFATIFTSNFSETGEASGRALQDEIVAFARANGIRLLGPNCNGFINFVDAFAFASTAAIKGPRKPAGDVGLVCHSGGLGQMNIMWRAQEAGLGITYEVSCGNEADLDATDFMRFMIDDERTRVIMVAVETIRDGRKFAEVARHAADREKPLVMLKFGRTDAGRRAAASHTGALTGADEVHDAAFRQYGVLRVTDCNELYEVAKLLRRRKWPRGNRAAALSGSGGHSVLIADLGAASGIDWVPYQDQTVNGLRELMPDFAGVSNPTDLTSALTGSKHLFEDALNVVAQDDGVDVLIPVLVAPTVPAIETVVKLADATDKAVAVLWTGYCPTDPQVVAATLVARGLPVYRDALTCLKAVRAAMTYGEFLRAHKRAASEPPVRPAGIDVAQAKELIAAGAGNMTERQSKEVLAAYGLHITQERLATNSQNAVSSARDIGKPVALKIESPDSPHKTEANAIRLDVTGDAEVARAFDEVMAAARRYQPEARLGGVLVQEMAPGGVEVMLG